MNTWESFSTRRLHQARHQEAELVVEELARFGRFQRIIELGSGDGYQTQFLSRLGMVFPSDCSVERFEGRVCDRFVQCDAQRLPYASATFDLLFSSNVVEHIQDKQMAFTEMMRVTRQRALIVHVVPTHIWKVLSIPSYYVALALKGVRKMLESIGIRKHTLDSHATLDEKNLRSRQMISYLRPQVHGTASSNRTEFIEFNPKYWRWLFEQNGFICLRQVNLLTYSPHEVSYLPPNRWLATRGFASSVAFFLCKQNNET